MSDLEKHTTSDARPTAREPWGRGTTSRLLRALGGAAVGLGILAIGGSVATVAGTVVVVLAMLFLFPWPGSR